MTTQALTCALRLAGLLVATVAGCGAPLPVVNCFTDADCPSGTCQLQGDDRVCVGGATVDADAAGPDTAADVTEDAPDDTVEPDDTDTVEPDTADIDTAEPDTVEPDTIEPDTTPTSERGLCGDGIDNDGDRLVDCSDNDCEGDPACEGCGNGVADEGEECDGRDLNNLSCDELGYVLGDLGCTSSCVYDTSECSGTLTLELQNDTYGFGEPFTTSAVEVFGDDIVAACFAPAAPTLAYRFVEISVAFGGGLNPLTDYPTRAIIYGSGDATTPPDNVLARTGEIDLNSSDRFLNDFDIEALDVRFQGPVCVGFIVPEDGRPSFGFDAALSPNVGNWYFISGTGDDENFWISSADNGFPGDWIIRATVEPVE